MHVRVASGETGQDGFGLVEVIVSMLLLAIIAVALLPALWQGIVLATQQTTTATATRQLNSLIEQARDDASCENLNAIANSPTGHTYRDGRGSVFTVTPQAGYSCTAGGTVRLTLTAVDESAKFLATVNALVFVP